MFKSPEIMRSEPIRPEIKKEELSEEEILDVISIVDVGPKHLDKVTPDNIGEIIEKGERALKEQRAEINESLPDKSPSEVFEVMENRSSACHAIQCSLNRAEDFKAFQNHIREFSAERRIDEKDENFERLNRFSERHVKMNELLTRLYEIDIARRVGLAKNEEKFFERESPLFAKKLIEKSLAEFEEANEEKIKESPGLRTRMEELKVKLREADYETLKQGFYGICQDYSRLIFGDFEQLHAKDLKNAAENLGK